MARRGPVADWPTPEKGANPTAVRRARRERAREEERLTGMCRVCQRETLAQAYLCARCWAAVPRPFVEALSEANRIISAGDPVYAGYGLRAPANGYELMQTLERHQRTALIACEIAARIFGDP